MFVLFLLFLCWSWNGFFKFYLFFWNLSLTNVPGSGDNVDFTFLAIFYDFSISFGGSSSVYEAKNYALDESIWMSDNNHNYAYNKNRNYNLYLCCDFRWINVELFCNGIFVCAKFSGSVWQISLDFRFWRWTGMGRNADCGWICTGRLNLKKNLINWNFGKKIKFWKKNNYFLKHMNFWSFENQKQKWNVEDKSEMLKNIIYVT